MQKTLLFVCAALLVLPSLAAAAPVSGQGQDILLASIFAAEVGVQEPIALAPDWFTICGTCSPFGSDCSSWCGPGYTGTCRPIRACDTPDGGFSHTYCYCVKN